MQAILPRPARPGLATSSLAVPCRAKVRPSAPPLSSQRLMATAQRPQRSPYCDAPLRPVRGGGPKAPAPQARGAKSRSHSSDKDPDGAAASPFAAIAAPTMPSFAPGPSGGGQPAAPPPLDEELHPRSCTLVVGVTLLALLAVAAVRGFGQLAPGAVPTTAMRVGTTTALAVAQTMVPLGDDTPEPEPEDPGDCAPDVGLSPSAYDLAVGPCPNGVCQPVHSFPLQYRVEIVRESATWVGKMYDHLCVRACVSVYAVLSVGQPLAPLALDSAGRSVSLLVGRLFYEDVDGAGYTSDDNGCSWTHSIYGDRAA